MNLKQITMEQAIRSATNPEKKVYRLVRLLDDDTVLELDMSDGFYIDEPETEPAPEPSEKHRGGAMKPADHGRIVALYTANPPRSIKWIADDMRISQQTVINHLKKEGLYEK